MCSLRSWQYCVLGEWDLVAQPLYQSSESCEAVRNTKRLVPTPFFVSRLRRQNFNHTIPPAAQAKQCVSIFLIICFLTGSYVQWSKEVELLVWVVCSSYNDGSTSQASGIMSSLKSLIKHRLIGVFSDFLFTWVSIKYLGFALVVPGGPWLLLSLLGDHEILFLVYVTGQN